ncbi:hypothetical protein D1007_37160 [Hordeum vulgare]|nr:hypothetical protein D1007_37160 [Hordeum vulgare]KAI5012692.1 hypothetical protein ZWY2020_024958 [Hordeum vulgare]
MASDGARLRCTPEGAADRRLLRRAPAPDGVVATAAQRSCVTVCSRVLVLCGSVLEAEGYGETLSSLCRCCHWQSHGKWKHEGVLVAARCVSWATSMRSEDRSVVVREGLACFAVEKVGPPPSPLAATP